MLSKVELRSHYKKIRNDFLDCNPRAGQGIAQNLHQIINNKKSIWGSYLPKGSEADPTLSSKSLIEWAYPKVRSGEIHFFIPHDTNWEVNQYQIREPGKNSTPVEIDNLVGMLIPGLAFDRKGHRLGSGKGYYDKFLSNFEGLKVGVAFSVQIIPSLPAQEHDIQMDIIVTEKEIIQVSERKAS